MPRPKKETGGIRATRAAGELGRKFRDVYDAAVAFNAGADPIGLEIALDSLSRYEAYEEWPAADADDGPEERLLILVKQLAITGQLLSRLTQVRGEVQSRAEQLRSDLTVAITERASLPAYAETLFRRLQAEGGGQEDFHPGSRALARAMLSAARAHNRERRGLSEGEELYNDQPISKWSDLPRELNGFAFVNLAGDEGLRIDPTPLPPSTNIAEYTINRKKPKVSSTYRQTLLDWTSIITSWANRVGKPLSEFHASTWAFLLSHRLKNVEPILKNLDGREMQSPWNPGELVKIVAVDDVPY